MAYTRAAVERAMQVQEAIVRALSGRQLVARGGGTVPKCPVIDALFEQAPGAGDESPGNPRAGAVSRRRLSSP